MKRFLKLTAVVIILVFIITGCTSKASNDIGDAIASVNGKKISMQELDIKVDQFVAMYQADQPGQEMNVDTLNYLKEQVLESLIDEILLEETAAKEKIEVTSEELKSEIESVKEQIGDAAAYKEFLDQRKMSEEQLEGYIKSQLLINKMFELVTKDIVTATQNPEEFYNNNLDQFQEPQQRQVRHILVNSEEIAKSAIARLEKGEDFKKLTVELSTDPDVKQAEGLVDYFDINNLMMVREFIDASFALEKEGDYTKTPIQTMFGFHVIKLEDIKGGKLYTFEEMKDMIVERLLLEEKQNKFMEYTQGLRGEAKIINKLSEILDSQPSTTTIPSLPFDSGKSSEEKPAESESK